MVTDVPLTVKRTGDVWSAKEGVGVRKGCGRGSFNALFNKDSVVADDPFSNHRSGK